jgi:hypothetical protein
VFVRRPLALTVAVLALAAPTAFADDLPARDQYIGNPPNMRGTSEAPRLDRGGSGSSEARVLTRITATTGERAQRGRPGDDQTRSPEAKIVIPPATGDDPGKGQGALSAATEVLFDWSDPFVPGLITLLALFTLVAVAIALVKRNQA